MSRAVDHLADLTGTRDSDLLDATLAAAFQDLLRPRVVAIYRCVGEGEQQRWLMRARLTPQDSAATADPLWADLETLPLLAAQPERRACLLQQEAITVDGSPALAYFPLSTERETVGVLEIETDAVLGYDDVRLVSSMLRLYRNFQGLLDYSERDTLTGLLNRKTFDDSFMRVAASALALPALAVLPGATPATPPRAETRRSGPAASAWLAVVDIDHFKRVNDEHGHLIGDEVLLLLSRLMRSSFRLHDRLYRFGGEEFVVLMRCAGAAEASLAFQRLRLNVERYVFPQVGRLTVSIGFTELRTADTPSLAFERADQAVYHVKQNGRNATADHALLVREGQLSETLRISGEAELF